eukprot:10594755-Alexandrium_andersonii.AAC.1
MAVAAIRRRCDDNATGRGHVAMTTRLGALGGKHIQPDSPANQRPSAKRRAARGQRANGVVGGAAVIASAAQLGGG